MAVYKTKTEIINQADIIYIFLSTGRSAQMAYFMAVTWL